MEKYPKLHPWALLTEFQWESPQNNQKMSFESKLGDVSMQLEEKLTNMTTHIFW